MPASAPPLLIASAPNGAYKTRRDHHALPVTPAQLAATAAAVAEAGARMLHLHVRNARGEHTLDIAAYRAAIRAIRAQVGDNLFIQATSESAGAHTAAQQRKALYALSGGYDAGGDREAADAAATADAAESAATANVATVADAAESADATDATATADATESANVVESAAAAATTPPIDGVSIAPRELIRGKSDAAPAARLLRHLRRRNILIQYILYSPADIAHYKSLLAQQIIPPGLHSLLLVVGRHDARSPVPALHQLLDALRAAPPATANWMTCAFGEGEFACLRETAKLGGHIRIGFENTLRLQSGRLAADNRELIAQAVECGNPGRRPVADAAQAWGILGSAADARE
ncbi:MAG: 3-keto-5-aminohexanoate cleavage protein [Gammaproteobacteria bacterium]